MFEVDGLIFDVDGTLYNTRKVSVHSVMQTMERLGKEKGLDIPVPSAETIIGLFGETPDDIYRALLPEEAWIHGKQFLEWLEGDEIASIKREEGELFPNVRETFIELRNRGYALGIYSNGPTEYFRSILGVYKLEELVDFSTCIGEHPYLKKPGLLALVKDRIGARKVAVVGDRYHDIEAARELGDVAVGTLYGFGGAEMEKADLKLKDFGELLDAFPTKDL